MNDYALVLNAGSSSLKFCVYHLPPGDSWPLAARGQIEGIGSTPRLQVKDRAGRDLESRALDGVVCHGHDAPEVLFDWLRSYFGESRIAGVGHRVVHGGPNFGEPVVLTSDVMAELRSLIPLAPLHQPYNLAAIDAVTERLPGVPQVACFDTAFHRDQPEIAHLVPLPAAIRGCGVQRYGFHGLSYEFVASVLPAIAPELAAGRVIVAHLGSGASLCAVKGGKSIECTLGFTALDGLCMGTRPGALDPGVVLYLQQNLGYDAGRVEETLYRKSGLLGISGISNDMRDLLGNPDPKARLAVDYFIYQAAKQIGSLAAVLRGVDGMVFTAGIGENSPEIRQRIADACGWLGFVLDPDANKKGGPRISAADSRVSAWVIPTNEEIMIARHTGRLLGLG